MAAETRQYNLKLNTKTDADVISYMERQANKNDAVRRALRSQMKAEE